IRLIELWIKNGIFSKFEYLKHTKGVHQGDILSPLLSNIYLDQMDKYLHAASVDFVRYADDFVMFASSKDQAELILSNLRKFLTTIKLSLNESKTAVFDRNSKFNFLGASFLDACLLIDDEKFDKILKKLSSQAAHADIKDNIVAVNSYVAHLRNIDLSLFSPAQQNIFSLKFDETMTKIVRKVLKTADKKSIADALSDLDFPYPLTNKLKKEKLFSYYKNAKAPQVKSVRNALEAKKREYLRSFSHSSLLHITTPFYFFGLSGGKLVLKSYGKIKHAFPINKISHIIINTSVTISSAVIKECAKKQIAIDFIDEKTNLSYATLITSNSAVSKIVLSQIAVLKTKKALKIAMQFVTGKIKNQINYLKSLNKYHKILDEQITAMQERLDALEKATSSSELMGFEGSAANAYWQGIAKVIDYKFSFNERVTQGANDIVNMALNYGYAILYSQILKALASVGLSPHVSYLHAMDGQKPTLSFDMIEEFRAFIVDRTIVSMINKNEPFALKDGALDVPTRINIAKNINEKLFSYTRFRSEELKVEHIIEKQAYALRACVLEGVKYKPFIARFQ
ncbi:MAG: CRISPR-associated endonuclease Cas1, partial [Campylobacter sp.]|nr:CRISPR-associated endonuclease Cas1 [Campylobacter sp.]